MPERDSEQRLRRAAEANAKFRTLFEHGTQFAGILALDGSVVESNRLSLDACGLERADVIGKPFWECAWWSPSKEVRDTIRAATLAAAAGQPFHGESRYFIADGSERLVALSIAPVTDDAGHILFVSATGMDITDRKRTEAALLKSEDDLRFALRAGRMGTWHIDLETHVMTCSDTCKANYGRAATEAFGYDALAESVLADDRPGWRAAVDACVADRGELDIEYRTRWPNGTIHWVQVRGSCTVDARGKLSLSGVSLDIDERRRSEERLRLLVALGEATRVSSDPSAIMAVTNRLLGTHLAVTRSAYADVELDGDRFTIRSDWMVPGAASLVGTHSLDGFGTRTATDLRDGRTLAVRDVDRELPASDAAAFRGLDVRAFICSPLVKEGKLVALMAVHHADPRSWTPSEIALVDDVADRSWAHIERVRAAETLLENARQKDEFLATLAHELRNPLAPIRTGLEVLKRAPSDSERPESLTARSMMDRQLGHMVRLIDDLLDISRISRGKLDLVRRPIALRDVIDSAVEASGPLADAALHTLSVRVADEPIALDGDLTRLAQVVTNLLNNSVKYTPHGGRIELTAGLERGLATIRVTDNGAGISGEMLPVIFDPFSQVNQTLHRAQGGLGIGLSLVKKLVEMHGGTVEAASPGLGKGSTFTVRLVASAVAAGQPTVVQSNGSAVGGAPAANRRRRVLVVDDNEDAAELLATMLELNGHDARAVNDGRTAIAAVQEQAPEIVFLDIGMPGMDGYEVARTVRADPKNAGTVLVALTGWGSADDKRRTKEAGFDHHLTKPVEPSLVDALLAELPR